MIRKRVAKALWAQGTGRHTAGEIAELGIRDIEALAALIGDKPFLFGETPCGADATVFACVAGTLCTVSDTPVRTAAEQHANLAAYRDRLMKAYFPSFTTA
jgi:glutathione S-transferase